MVILSITIYRYRLPLNTFLTYFHYYFIITIISEILRYMHKFTLMAIIMKGPLVFAEYLYHSKVLSEGSYEVMTKLDGLLPITQAAVLSQFMKEDMSNSVKNTQFLEAIRNDSSLLQLLLTNLCISKFIVKYQKYLDNYKQVHKQN